MNSEMVIVITVFVLAMFLGTWGASLVVRALASRASRIAMRLARRIPKSLNTAPPTLSPLQFWFGMIAGPVFALGGSTLAALVTAGVVQDGARQFSWSAIPAVFAFMLAIGALVVGMRWDRAKGRRRCPTCWYDFTGLADDAPCPECGNVPGSAKALSRTRRSRGVLMASPILLVLAWLAYVTPTALRTSWRAFVPTTVLIGFYEYMPDSMLTSSSRGDDGSLEARLGNDRVARWQRQWLSNRACRMVTTSADPRVCAFSVYFAGAPGSHGDDDADAMSANMLRVAFAALASSDPKAATYSGSLLVQPIWWAGPKTTEVFDANLGTVLARFQTPTGRMDHAAFGRLIGRFAKPTDDVVACVRDVALDPQWQGDRRDHAAALLGLLASRDPSLVARLQSEYASAQGPTREMLALALLNASVQCEPAPDGSELAAADTNLRVANSAKIAAALKDPDLAMRRAGVKLVLTAPAFTFPAFDKVETSRDIVECVKTDDQCAALGIRSLGAYGITDELVPTVARIIDSGTPEDVAMIADVIHWAYLDADWMAIREPLKRRLKDPALSQTALASLAAAKAKLDAIAPEAMRGETEPAE